MSFALKRANHYGTHIAALY